MSPGTRREYWAALRPLLARNWSAAAQGRLSSVSVARSFPDGAIHCKSAFNRPRKHRREENSDDGVEHCAVALIGGNRND